MKIYEKTIRVSGGRLTNMAWDFDDDFELVEIPEEASAEEERQTAEKRAKTKRAARKIMLEIRAGANRIGHHIGCTLSPEDCKTLADAWDLENV